MTFAVDWALRTNYRSMLTCCASCHNNILYNTYISIFFEFRAAGGSAVGGGGSVSVSMTKAQFTAECYNMDHEQRGTAIIFNNKKFEASTGMGERTGTDIDAEKLYMALTEMGFNTHVKNDCTIREMESYLVKSNNDFIPDRNFPLVVLILLAPFLWPIHVHV